MQNVGFTNIHSIRNKYASRNHYNLTENLHIVGLSETWPSSTDSLSFISEITPATHIFHSLPHVGKRGGGVGFYVHIDFQSSVEYTQKYQSFEHIVISIKLCDNFYNFVSPYKPKISNLPFLWTISLICLDKFLLFLYLSLFQVISTFKLIYHLPPLTISIQH